MLKDIFIKNEGRLFLILIALHLFPIWFFDNFATSDGWTHSYNTFLLNEYFFGQFEHFSSIYQINPSYDPNWVINILQLFVSKIFSFWANDKIFLSLYIVLFPLSLRYAISVVNKEASFIALLSIPFIYSMAMFLGFFGYLLGLPVAFFLVGYFIRHSHHWQPINIVVFAAGSMLLYLFHIVGFGLTFIALGIFNLAHIIHGSIKVSSAPGLSNSSNIFSRISFIYNKKILKNRLLIPLIAIAPTLILIFIFLSHRSPASGDEGSLYLLALSRLKEIFVLYLYIPFTNKAGFLTIPLSILMLSLLFYYVVDKIKNKKWSILDSLFIVFIAELAVYLFVPNLFVLTEDGKKNGGWMPHRLLPYLIAFSILLISMVNYSQLQKRVLIALSTVLTLGLFIINVYYFSLIDKQLDEYFSGNHLYKPHSTLLSITGRKGGYLANDTDGVLTTYSQPFLHAASKIALENKLIYLENVEAKFLYYAIQYKKDKNPFRLLNTNEMIAPRIDALAYEKETGIPVDYISVWLGRKTLDTNTGEIKQDMAALYQQLDKNTHYKKIFTSKNGLLEIYQRQKAMDGDRKLSKH